MPSVVPQFSDLRTTAYLPDRSSVACTAAWFSLAGMQKIKAEPGIYVLRENEQTKKALLA